LISNHLFAKVHKKTERSAMDYELKDGGVDQWWDSHGIVAGVWQCVTINTLPAVFGYHGFTWALHW